MAKPKQPDFEDSNLAGDPDAKGMKEGTKAEEAADRAEEAKDKKPAKKKVMPFTLKGLRVTKRTPGRNKASVI